MNERIQELAKQAGMVMYPTGLGISENTIWGDRNISKFAELLIKECTRVLEQQGATTGREEYYYGASLIDEHLGIN